MRLTSRTRSQLSGDMARSVAPREAMPALATTTSRPPKRSTTVATARCMAPRSVTSADRPIARVSWSSPAARSAASAWRSTTATDAPRPTSAREVAKPIPRAPPVTSATLPERSYRSRATGLRLGFHLMDAAAVLVQLLGALAGGQAQDAGLRARTPARLGQHGRARGQRGEARGRPDREGDLEEAVVVADDLGGIGGALLGGVP